MVEEENHEEMHMDQIFVLKKIFPKDLNEMISVKILKLDDLLD
jgi:hypothetical protein